MEHNSDGILMFLDFEKAFDLIEWSFLFKTLKQFNFGDNFIKYINILYTKPIFRIKNNGWISKTCSMSRGIRQGCPISALLYIFVAEILALKLKGDILIKGENINMSTEIKYIQQADGLTLAVENIQSLEKALINIKNFCDHAGSKINIMTKTQCILLGKLKDRYKEISGIKTTNDAVNCLGIYVGHNKTQCYKLTWIKIYEDMERFF